jgi:hypothetical protein
VLEQQLEKQTSISVWLRRHLAAYISSGLIMGLLVVAFIANPRLHQALILATTEQPQPVTEMSFTDANNLPSVALPNSPILFGFKLTNHMSRTTTYHYEVVEASAVGATVVKKGEVTVPNNSSATITEVLVLIRPSSDTQILIVLANPSQHIDFWVHSS